MTKLTKDMKTQFNVSHTTESTEVFGFNRFTTICFGYITVCPLWFPHKQHPWKIFYFGKSVTPQSVMVKRVLKLNFFFLFFNLLRCIVVHLYFRMSSCLGTILKESKLIAVSNSDQQVGEESLNS